MITVIFEVLATLVMFAYAVMFFSVGDRFEGIMCLGIMIIFHYLDCIRDGVAK